MKPAWDQLIQAFADSKTVLVADVDCTAAGKTMCEEVGVQGYPTIKYGDPNALEDYEGGRGFDELKEFADTNLGPSCGPAYLDLCDEAKKAEITKLMAESMSDLQAKVDEKTKAIAEEESKFEKAVEGLQAQYEALDKAKTEAVKAIKDSGLGLLKSVVGFKKTEKAAKDEM